MFKMDLSGLWDVNMACGAMECPPEVYPERISLPGTTSAAGLGPENARIETGFLKEAHPFCGTVWYRRFFTAEPGNEEIAILFLERTKKTRVYLDGVSIGSCDSLCTPHVYVLPNLKKGAHTLEVAVSNDDLPVPGGHMTSPDSQGNWNGITGEISLFFGSFYPKDLSVIPDSEGNTLHITAEMLGAADGETEAHIESKTDFCLSWKDHRLDQMVHLPFVPEHWSADDPRVYTLRIGPEGSGIQKSFGFRTLGHRERSLLVNGKTVFLRGKTESLIFPKTGHAPMDTAAWIDHLKTIKEYGINHLRCHTCCPPEAAFEAADRLGMYLEPELPFWGTIADTEDEKYVSGGQKYLFEEGLRILKAYGSHPSFVLFSLGNELWGSRETMGKWIRAYRSLRPDILYLSGSNNFFVTPSVHPAEDIFSGVRLGHDRLLRGSFAMCDAPLGRIQTEAPNTDWDYDEVILQKPDQPDQDATNARAIKIQAGTGVSVVEGNAETAPAPSVPIVTHEVGQYTFYPCFDEEQEYTGPLKARYLIPMRKRLQENGLFQDWKRYFLVAGKLSVDCYRAEIEAALRSRELAGFQLLDLQDFAGQGIALIGILNVFMENKGICPPEVWRQFCADTVLLARLPGFSFQSGDALRFSVQIACDHPLPETHVRCQLEGTAGIYTSTEAVVPAMSGRLSEQVPALLPLPRVSGPERLTLTLELDNGIKNTYPITLFPPCPELVINPRGIRFNGKSVRFVSAPGEDGLSPREAIVVPAAEQKLPACYAPDFWCYPMFKSISQSMGKPEPIGTMGLSICREDPLLRSFPSEDYTTPVWYPILEHAHCEPAEPDRMIAEMIDNPTRAQRLGILYIKDGYLHLTSRLWEAQDAPEVKALALSLLKGMDSLPDRKA